MFDFLIDIVPRDEIQVKPTKKQVRQSTAPCMPHQRNMRNLVSCVGLLFCSVLLPPLSSSSHPHLMPSTHLLHSTPHYFFHSNCVSHLLLTPPLPFPPPFTSLLTSLAGREPPCSLSRAASATHTALSEPTAGAGASGLCCRCPQHPPRGRPTAAANAALPGRGDKP